MESTCPCPASGWAVHVLGGEPQNGADWTRSVIAAEIIEMSQKMIPPILGQIPEVEVSDELPHSGAASL